VKIDSPRSLGVFSAFALALAPAAAVFAVPVTNHSFEDPELPNVIPSAQPGAPGWDTTGNDFSDPNAPIVNTGEFRNLDSDIEIAPGVFAKRIDNADGADQHADGHTQLAFISAGNAGGSLTASFSQTLADTYDSDPYTMSIGLAKSSVQPPTTGSVIRFGLYYDNGGSLAEIASTVVDQSQLQDNHLLYFDAQGFAPAGAIGKPVTVLITTADNTAAMGGTFDFDNVSVAPEPATGLAAVALAGAGLLGRRRARRRA
jgi:MYXO-CTERM domain-containing protein